VLAETHFKTLGSSTGALKIFVAPEYYFADFSAGKDLILGSAARPTRPRAKAGQDHHVQGRRVRQTPPDCALQSHKFFF